MIRTALGLASRGRLSILIFHRVLAAADPLRPGDPSAAEFEALMSHVKRGYAVLPLREAVERLANGSLPPNAVSITFDDGYQDNVTIAAPILARLGIPATVFVSTGYLDGGCMFNDLVIEAIRGVRRARLDVTAIGLGELPMTSVAERLAAVGRVLEAIKYRPADARDDLARRLLAQAGVPRPQDLMMSRESLRALQAAGFDVGAHTVTHPILANLADDAARQEIVGAKRELEGLLDREITLFAYPNGKPMRDYAPKHVKIVREAGYRAAVSTAWGVSDRATDVFQLRRFTPWTRSPLKFDWLMLRNLRHGATPQAA